MSLVAWLQLNGNVDDVKGNTITSTTTSFVSGRTGQALDFNNSASVNIQFTKELNKEKFSFSYWGRGTGVPTANYQRIFQFYDTNDTQYLYGDTRLTTSPHILHIMKDYAVSSWTTQIAIPNADYINWEWHHYSVVFEGKTFSTYRDGVLVLTNTITQDSAPYTNLSYVDINGSNTCSFELSDFRVFDHILSEKEIKEIAKAKILHYNFNQDTYPLLLDSSGYNHHSPLTVNAPTWTTNSKIGSGCYEFDGVNDYTYKTDFISQYGITNNSVSMWVLFKPSAMGKDSRFYWHGNYGIMFYKATDNKIRNYLNNGTTAISFVSPAVVADTWYHIVGTYDNAVGRLYINGTLSGSVNLTGPLLRNVAPNELKLGSYYSNYFANILMDDVQVYGTTLSASDVLGIYQTKASLDNQGNFYINQLKTASFPTDGLVLHVDPNNDKCCNEDTPTAIYDLSPSKYTGTVTGTSIKRVKSSDRFVLDFQGTIGDDLTFTSPNLSASNNTVILIARYKVAGGRLLSGANNWLLGHAGSFSDYYAKGWVDNNADTSTAWHFHAVTGNPTTDTWMNYIDGTTLVTNNAGSAGPTTFNFARFNTTEYSQSQFALLLAYNRVLSTAEIDAIYESYKTVLSI